MTSNGQLESNFKASPTEKLFVSNRLNPVMRLFDLPSPQQSLKGGGGWQSAIWRRNLFAEHPLPARSMSLMLQSECGRKLPWKLTRELCNMQYR
jgi:hypothetical protein